MSAPGAVVVDQEELGDYESIRLPGNWIMECPYRHQEMAGTLRWIFSTFPGLDYYGLLTDGTFPRTHEWDTKLVEAAGKEGIASGNDNWRRGKRIYSPSVFGGDLLRALGFWAPEGFVHFYVDDVWDCIAQELDCWTWMEDVQCEYFHYARGNRPMDAQGKRVFQGKGFSESDKKAWLEWKENATEFLDRVRSLTGSQAA